jgi:hypothetical protein
MRRFILSIFLAAIAGSPARGADPFYAGTWKIQKAVVAPWWPEKETPDPSESKLLVGKSFSIRANAITGPRQVACPGPRFKLQQSPADMLFQGMLENVRSQASVLASLGFEGKQWKTITTGCENELDFHFVNDRTLTFALDNYIYFASKR